MSLAIDIDRVVSVLLADGWHEVADESFNLDSYEFMWSGREGTKVADLDTNEEAVLLHGGGQSGVCSVGFTFLTKDGAWLSGPLTSVLAVRR